jgi:hypothetical protein
MLDFNMEECEAARRALIARIQTALKQLSEQPTLQDKIQVALGYADDARKNDWATTLFSRLLCEAGSLADKVGIGTLYYEWARENGCLGPTPLRGGAGLQFYIRNTTDYSYVRDNVVYIAPSSLVPSDIPVIKTLLENGKWWRHAEPIDWLNAWNDLLPSIETPDRVLVQPCKTMDRHNNEVMPLRTAIEALEAGHKLAYRRMGNNKMFNSGWGWGDNYIVKPGTGLEIHDPKNWVLPEGAVSFSEPNSHLGNREDIIATYRGWRDMPKSGSRYKYRFRLWAAFGVDTAPLVQDNGSYRTRQGLVTRLSLSDCDFEKFSLRVHGGGGDLWSAYDEFVMYHLK